MKRSRKNRFSALEVKKSKREALIIILSLLLIVFLTHAELRLSDISSDVRTVDNILIFGLINVVILLIVLLVYLVCRNIARILLERKRNPFGSKLRGKLVVAFVALSLIPTLLLFFVSASFINSSIKNWFNKQIEWSLSESLEVAQTYYRKTAEDALHFGRQISTVLADRGLLDGRNSDGLGTYVDKIRTEYGIGIIEVYSASKEELARSISHDVPHSRLFQAPSRGHCRCSWRQRVQPCQLAGEGRSDSRDSSRVFPRRTSGGDWCCRDQLLCAGCPGEQDAADFRCL